jgi:hypothetical protein
MKTTIEIQDDLLERSKRLARQEGTTLRVIIEESLQLALRARSEAPPALRGATLRRRWYCPAVPICRLVTHPRRDLP